MLLSVSVGSLGQQMRQPGHVVVNEFEGTRVTKDRVLLDQTEDEIDNQSEARVQVLPVKVKLDLDSVVEIVLDALNSLEAKHLIPKNEAKEMREVLEMPVKDSELKVTEEVQETANQLLLTILSML